MTGEVHPGIRVANTVAALHAALDKVNAWADDETADLAAPFEGIDVEVLRGLVRTSAVTLTSMVGAVAFGLHLGAALARLVDDPSFGLPIVPEPPQD